MRTHTQSPASPKVTSNTTVAQKLGGLVAVCLLIGCDSKTAPYGSDEKEILAYLDKLGAETKSDGKSKEEVLAIREQVIRMKALLETEDAKDSIGGKLPRALSGLVSSTIAGHRIPLPDQGIWEPLGASSHLESTSLYDKEKRGFFSGADLEGMSPKDVSLFDVGPDHPAWYTLDQQPQDPVGKFKETMVTGIINALREEDDPESGLTWDADGTRRVLFMEHVYKSATSAKAEVEDVYGAEWKIKWGDEVQSEAISSRLYLMAGGRMTDLIIAGGGGPDQMIMILAEEGEYENSGDEAAKEREPETIHQLAEALHDFYGFDIAPYIHSHGTIGEDDVDSIRHILPPGGKKKYRPSELVGRKWVSFREYSLELRPKGFIHTISGSLLTDPAAKNDRVSRGLYLFSLWLSARDSKSDNSKTYFIKSPVDGPGSEMEISAHAAGLHDLGVTLGKMGAAGMINEMTTGEDFLWKSLSEKSIRSRQAFVYLPEPYTSATWADSRWMAIRIAGISDKQLSEAIAASNWPDFVQSAVFYKLAARRNRIAEMFEIPPDAKRGDALAPNFSVDLSTPEKVAEIERRYELEQGSLQGEVARRKSDNLAHEVLVDSGQIANTDNSALITQLVIQRFPAGLSDRYRRTMNLNPKAIRTK